MNEFEAQVGMIELPLQPWGIFEPIKLVTQEVRQIGFVWENNVADLKKVAKEWGATHFMVTTGVVKPSRAMFFQYDCHEQYTLGVIQYAETP